MMSLAYSNTDDDEVYTEDELTKLTKAQLLVLCDELGVEGVSNANLKAEIIAAILNR